MTILWPTLTVRNVDASLAFYSERLGFKRDMAERDATGATFLGSVEVGDTVIMFESAGPGGCEKNELAERVGVLARDFRKANVYSGFQPILHNRNDLASSSLHRRFRPFASFCRSMTLEMTLDERDSETVSPEILVPELPEESQAASLI